jgi:hypothetical protein
MARPSLRHAPSSFRCVLSVVKHIECPYPEFGVHPLRNCLCFGQGEMEIRASRPPEEIARETIA